MEGVLGIRKKQFSRSPANDSFDFAELLGKSDPGSFVLKTHREQNMLASRSFQKHAVPPTEGVHYGSGSDASHGNLPPDTF